MDKFMDKTSLTVKLAFVFIPIVILFVLVDMYLSHLPAVATTIAKFVAAFIIFNVWLKMNVADPLKKLADYMGEVASGNYDNDISRTRQDDIGKLQQAVDAMQRQLATNTNESRTESAASARIASALQVCQANVMMADTDLNIIYKNDSVTEMLSKREQQIQTVLPKFSVADLIGTCVDDFHANPAHQRGMLERLTEVYKTDLELAGLTFGLIATPVFDDKGKRLGTVVEWDDKTERLAAEKQAREMAAANARVANALKVCQANVMMADADLNIVYTNDSVIEMLTEREQQIQTKLPSFSVANLIGTCVDDFHANPAHQRGMLERLTEVYKTDLQLAGLTFGLIATPVFDDDGARLGTVVEWDDKTERLAAEKAAKELADKNAGIASALQVCQANVMMADNDMNIVYCNDAVSDMMKEAEADLKKVLSSFDANNLIGTCVDVFHKDPGRIRDLVAALTTAHHTEIKVGVHTFGLIATPVFNDLNERLGTVVEWRKRTDELAIEAEVNEMVTAASQGDLTNRIETSNKEGFFKRLALGLNQLVEVAEDVLTNTAVVLEALSNGDLTKTIEADYQGSFGKLKNDANTTVNKLTEIITEIRNSAASVSSGAQEISGGNIDLSQRTEEQASALEETAASMEEMTSAVRASASNAENASDLANDASSKAQTGGEVVGQAVDAMAEINDSSEKISDIIGVIDEIAFQTNLLALNAAVEAARAGEQGRGFAVVAAEVRNLAQRSATAANEIKDLIRDSVDKIKDGSKLVNESGDTLKEIVSAINQVTTIVSDISSSAREQAEGIDQVNTAISQMDETTQQNAALVEEASAASENMAEQAALMNELMDFFNTGGVVQSATREKKNVIHTPAEAVGDDPGKANTTAQKKVVQSDDDGWEEF